MERVKRKWRRCSNFSSIYQRYKIQEEENILDVIGGSIDIMGHELSNYELEGADYLLKIHTEDVSLLDASKMEYLYKRGYEEAKGK